MELLILAILVLMAVLGPRYGADSRDGRDWQPWELRGFLHR